MRRSIVERILAEEEDNLKDEKVTVTVTVEVDVHYADSNGKAAAVRLAEDAIRSRIKAGETSILRSNYGAKLGKVTVK